LDLKFKKFKNILGKKMSTMKAIDTKPPVVDEAPMSVTIKGLEELV